MTRYIVHRLFAMLPVVLGASLVIFVSLRLFAPVDFIEEALAASPAVNDPVLRERLRQELGLDKPVYVQYVLWIWGAARGDLGTSWISGRPVLDQIREALPLSIELTLLSTLLALLLSIPLGVISAVRQDRGPDYLARVGTVLGLSIPNFVLATVFLLLPAMAWGWAPPSGYVTMFEDPVKHGVQVVFPTLALGVATGATLVRMLRSTMLEVIRTDYVRTARAKGLSERVVLYQHGLKNALIPAVTMLGARVSFTLGGTVVVEQIYGLPGLGQLTLASLLQGDFPQLQANVLYLVLIYLSVNLLVDLSYAWLDPRIRYR